MSVGFSVKNDVFEGPLDLLLDLIEERKMLVSDVSLASVADSFLEYLQSKESFPIQETASFVLVASTLLLIKSRTLLPVLTLTDDEEGDVHDLERRLRLLAIIRAASIEAARSRARLYVVEGARLTDVLFAPPKELSVSALASALSEALHRVPRVEKHDEIAVKTVISLDAMIERLTERVQKAISMSFREFAGTDPREMVVGFLAMLELVKRGFADVRQGGQYDEITIEYAGGATTPTYE